MKRARNDFFESESTVKEDKVFSKNTEKPKKEKAKKDKPAKENKGGKKKTTLIIIICVVAVVLIAGALLFMYMTKKAEEERQQAVVNQILSVEVFHEGVVVDGIDITGLSKEDAKQMILAAHAEEDAQQYTVLKNAAYEQVKAAVDQRAAEEAAKQEAAAQAAAQAAAAAPEDDEEEEAVGEVVLDENGMPVEELPEEEEVPAEPAAPLYTEDANGNFLLNAECVTVTYNIDEVLEEAFGLAKEGSYEELLAEVEDIKTNGRQFNTERTLNVTGAKAAIQQIADQKDIAPIDAKLEFNTNYVPEKNDAGEIVNEDAKFAYIDEIAGISIDVDATYAALEALAQQGTIGEVEMVTAEVAPTTTAETLKGTIVLRGSFSTDFSGKRGYKERVHNITKAASMINGKVVQPGETFSMNDTLGVRNKANGWQMAGALSGGQADVKQYGGGVCQVSTTLYNAVVMGDLEIVYRQAHSEKSGYVKGGLDATINSVGNKIDFQWKNNTNSPVMIVAYTVGYDLYVDVYGEPFATDEYDEIKLTSKQISTIQPSGEITYQVDTTKPANYSKELVPRRIGSKWQSYKNYYKNGELVKTEKLATSTYRAYAGITIVGQLPASPSPSAPGTTTPAPGTATPAPSTPTPAPADPTPAPADPTPAPADPTPAPADPTPAPADPAPEANTENTEAAA